MTFSPLSVLLHPSLPRARRRPRAWIERRRADESGAIVFVGRRARDGGGGGGAAHAARMDADGGVFAREADAEARWGAMTPNAFAETTTAPSVEAARRRSKTRSADLDAEGMGGFDFRGAGTAPAAAAAAAAAGGEGEGEGEGGDACGPGMFRVFGRDIGRPPLFSSFGAQNCGEGRRRCRRSTRAGAGVETGRSGRRGDRDARRRRRRRQRVVEDEFVGGDESVDVDALGATDERERRRRV